MKIETTILRNLLQNEDYTRKVLPFLEEDYFTNNNDTYREQQILGILLTLSDDDSYYNNKIDIRSILISFKDGRVIKTII